jgi:hypothetical protein
MNHKPQRPKQPTAKGQRYISVRAEKLPEPNWDNYARLLLDLAATDLAAKQKRPTDEPTDAA